MNLSRLGDRRVCVMLACPALLPATSDYDAWFIKRRGRVHGKGYGTNHTVRVIYEANEAPQISFANETLDIAEARMPMAR